MFVMLEGRPGYGVASLQLILQPLVPSGIIWLVYDC